MENEGWAAPTSTRSAENDTPASHSADKLEWTSHLLSEYPAKGVILMAVTILLCILVWLMFEHWLYVSVAAAVLFLSTMRYYFPVSYKLDGEGVRRRYLGREKFRPWSDFRNIYIHPDGVFLSPFEKPSRLDAFRGLYLNCGPGRDQAVAYIKEKLNIA